MEKEWSKIRFKKILFSNMAAEEVPKQLIPAAYFCTSHLK